MQPDTDNTVDTELQYSAPTDHNAQGELPIVNNNAKAETRSSLFTLVKAIAIICVVLSHAGIRGWLYNFVFIFHVPIFFLCAGYFFHTKYLNDERTSKGSTYHFGVGVYSF